MGSPSEPAVPAYRRLRVHRKLPQVLGLDLNRSEKPSGETPPPGTPPFAIMERGAETGG